MSRGLSDIFRSSVTSVSADVSSSAASATLLSCIAPNVNMNVAADVTKLDGLAGVQADVKNTIAAASECIALAQREIIEACVVAGESPGALFPDTVMASTEAELAFSAACEASGLGTLATFDKAWDAADLARNVAADRSRPAEEAKAEVRDILCASSQRQPSNQGGFGLITNAKTTPELAKGTAIDWKTTCTKFPEALDAIMHCDPQNPSEALFPELHALCALNKAIDQRLEEAGPAVKDDTLFPVSAAACEHMVSGKDQVARIECSKDDPNLHLVSLGKAERLALLEKVNQPPAVQAGLKDLAVAGVSALPGAPRPVREQDTA